MSQELKKQLENYVERKNFEKCPKCSSELSYKGAGTYECSQCGNIERNNYGKVRLFLSEKGAASVPEIVKGTGLRFSEVQDVLRNTDAIYASRELKKE